MQIKYSLFGVAESDKGLLAKSKLMTKFVLRKMVGSKSSFSKFKNEFLMLKDFIGVIRGVFDRSIAASIRLGRTRPFFCLFFFG